jgi:hypothetical protein
MASRDRDLHTDHDRTGFSHQVALILQSLGFAVVPVRAPGTTGVVALSKDCAFPVAPRALARPLCIPEFDREALDQQIQAALPEFETVPFALVVGPEPAGTLETKLATVQREQDVLVRYMEAELLERLRYEPGRTVDHQVFREALLAAEPILTDDDIDRLHEADRSTNHRLGSVLHGVLGDR